MEKKEFLLSESDAKIQIDGFLAYYDFDPEDIDDPKQRSNIQQAIKSLIKHCRRGRVEFGDDGTVKQTLSNGQILSYKRLGGENKRAMKGDTDDFYGRIYALIGSLTGLGTTAIAKLEGVDLAVAEAVGVVFLQAV